MQKMIYALVALLLAVASFCSISPASASTRSPADSVPGISDSTNDKIDSPSRIIGGNTAQISDAPWQVALITAWSSSDSQGQFCGGSVYNSQWIITAAHCLEELTPSSIRVLAGTSILSKVSLSKTYVNLIYLHPSYNPQTGVNDIGLIRLVGTLPLQPGIIEPISLPTLAPKPGSTARITGWGNISKYSNVYPDDLYKAHVLVNTDKNCSKVYSRTNLKFNSSAMTCANTPDFMIDTCQGDSGGPLAVYVAGRWELHGVTSTGIGCAQAPFPGVYTETYNYLGWIRSIAGDISALPFSSAPAPIISGIPFVGETLNASISGWSPTPTSVSYQWLRSGSATAIATGPSYTLTSSDLGKTITVKATGGAPGYASTTVTSASTGSVNPASFSSTSAPIISLEVGDGLHAWAASVGSELTASIGWNIWTNTYSWSPTPTSMTLQWFRSGSTTAIATGSSYTVTTSDSGRTITVKATGVRPGYVSTTVTSKGTFVLAPW